MEKSALIFILVAAFLVPDIIAQNSTTALGNTTAEPTTLGTDSSSVTTGVGATTEGTTGGTVTTGVDDTIEGTTGGTVTTGVNTTTEGTTGVNETTEGTTGGTVTTGVNTTTEGTTGGTVTTGATTSYTATVTSGGTSGGTTDSGTPTNGTANSGTDEPTEKPGTNAPTETPGIETKPPVKKFAGDLPITHINGTEAEFTSDLENPNSTLYKDLSDVVCLAVTTAIENSTLGSSVEGCSVSSFRNGSIVATFLLEFPADTNVTPEDLETTLKDAFENSTDPRIAILAVDTALISVEEVIPTTEVIPSTVPPTEGPGGLSPGAIAGIVVGCVAAVAIIVVLIVCLVVKNKERSSKVQDVEEQELTRPSSRGKSLPPDRVSNASDK